MVSQISSWVDEHCEVPLIYLANGTDNDWLIDTLIELESNIRTECKIGSRENSNWA